METITNKTTIGEMLDKLNAEGTYEEIPPVVEKILKKVSDDLVNTEAFRLAMLEKADFVAEFFCPSLPVSNTDKDKDIETAVKTAVSVTVPTVKINDSGLLELDTTVKVITFKQIYSAYVNHLAFSHADHKATKADRISANEHFFGKLGIGLLDLMTHSARKLTSIGTIKDGAEKLTTNANYKVSKSALDEFCKAQGKENPFDKDSNTGYSEQISTVLSYFTDNEVKTNAYYCKGLYQMICNRGKYGAMTFADTNTAMQHLAIICRYVTNGLRLPVTDKSNVYKVIK